MNLAQKIYEEIRFIDSETKKFELAEIANNIRDVVKDDLKDLLQYIKQNYTIGMGDGNYYNYDLDEVTIDDIINNWSSEREHK